MKQDEKHKYIAGLAFKLLLFFIVCMAGIGVLRLFEILAQTINL